MNRRARMLDQADRVDSGLELRAHHALHREQVERSLDRFDPPESPAAGPPEPRSGRIYRRILNSGPMNGFGYSWFEDRLARAGLPSPRLLARTPDWPGPSFGYEALNLVDGERTVGEIRDALAATVGDAPVEEVDEYLATLARLGVLEATPP